MENGPYSNVTALLLKMKSHLKTSASHTVSAPPHFPLPLVCTSAGSAGSRTCVPASRVGVRMKFLSSLFPSWPGPPCLLQVSGQSSSRGQECP